MGFFGIPSTAILLTLIATSYGRPTSEIQAKVEEIKQYRYQVAQLREVRPCYARLLEVKTDIEEFNEIKSEPHYVPECDKSGKKWRPAQCDHHNEGACFCVHEENGEVLEHSRNLNLNKEALGCGRRTANKDHSGHECFHMQDEFTHMQREYGLTGHTPLQYYPECTTKGKFMAMQRNDRSQFFCVDMDTGDIIPETETEANAMPPLTETICQAYDEIWKEFKKWNSTHDNEKHEKENEVTPGSCGVGFKYSECGCPVLCTVTSDTDSFNEDCKCKPACLCPKGMLELEGKCVSLEECHEAKPKTKVPQADKLDDLTAGKFTKWKEYMDQNPNAVLEAFNSMGMEEMQRMQYAGGPIAYDENPNGQYFRMRPLPVEGEEEPFGHFGAEKLEGGEKPNLRWVLSEGGLSEEEAEGHESNNRPEEESENQVPYFQSEGNYPEEEQTYIEEYYPEEEENTNDWEEFHQEEVYEEEYNSEEPNKEENFQEKEYYPTEESHYPEESNQNEYNKEFTYESHEQYPVTESKEVEETEKYVQESSSDTQQEEEPSYPYFEPEEVEPEEENISPSEGEEVENSPSNEAILLQTEEEESIHQEEEENLPPVEREEPENEVDDRLVKEELIEHQSQFTSVPTKEGEQENRESTPCDEEENSSVTPTEPQNRMYDTESAQAVIDRVLAPIEATFEKATQSVKKTG